MPQWQPHPVGHSGSPRAAAAVTHARTHCQWPPWPHAPHAHATPRTGSAQMEHRSAGCAAACSASPLLEGQACRAPEPAFGLARRASCVPAAAALADAPEEQKPSREPSRPHDVLLGMPGGTCRTCRGRCRGTCRGRAVGVMDCRGRAMQDVRLGTPPPPPPSREPEALLAPTGRLLEGSRRPPEEEEPEALLAPGPPSASRGMATCGMRHAELTEGVSRVQCTRRVA